MSDLVWRKEPPDIFGAWWIDDPSLSNDSYFCQYVYNFFTKTSLEHFKARVKNNENLRFAGPIPRPVEPVDELESEK